MKKKKNLKLQGMTRKGWEADFGSIIEQSPETWSLPPTSHVTLGNLVEPQFLHLLNGNYADGVYQHFEMLYVGDSSWNSMR